MHLKRLAAAATLLEFAYATNGPTGANNGSTPTSTDAGVTVHYITVGKAQNAFVPNSIVAKIGDIVSFQFYPSNHSVIRSAYGYPCIPIEDLGLPKSDPFFSGFKPVAAIEDKPPTWNLTVNTTEPIFYYCGAPGSCTGWGMVGVINANSSTSIATQIRLARQADYMLLPGESFPSEGQQASLDSLAHTATVVSTITASAAQSSGTSAAASSSNKSSGLSTGATAGIAVGAAVAALVLAGLFFLMCRTRSLKKELADQQATNNAAAAQQRGPEVASPRGYMHYNEAVRHNSQQLPPYHYQNVYGQENKVPGVDLWPVDQHRSGSPPSEYGSMPNQTQNHYFGAPSPDMNQQRFSRNTSELRGNEPPVVELDTPHQEMADRGQRFSS